VLALSDEELTAAGVTDRYKSAEKVFKVLLEAAAVTQ
jgi:hypothetical protein